MDYESLVENLVFWSECISFNTRARYACKQAANAITDLFGKVEQLQKESAELLARADTADRQRDAAIKELDDVAAAVDDLSDFIDEQIFPIVQYDIYTSLRDNADSISVWNHEKEWRGKKEE